ALQILWRASSIIETDFSKPNAIFLFAGILRRRRNSRPRFQYRCGRQVRPAHIARLQPDFLGNHPHQVELAEPRPSAEWTLPASFSQSTTPAGYRLRRRAV